MSEYDDESSNWAWFYLDYPLEIDYNELYDTDCMEMPVFELYARDQNQNDQFVRFRTIWNHFAGDASTGVASTLESYFDFDSHSGNLYISFEYAEYERFRDTYMTMYNSTEFMVVARLPGSQYEGTTVGWGELVSVLFNLKFIEPEEADKCLNINSHLLALR
jgi:hypothetical protein